MSNLQVGIPRVDSSHPLGLLLLGKDGEKLKETMVMGEQQQLVFVLPEDRPR